MEKKVVMPPENSVHSVLPRSVTRKKLSIGAATAPSTL